MRRLLAILITLECATHAGAGTLPLTGSDIVLMLRMGYSSEDILHDLQTKRFAGPLDSTSEAQIQSASPKLLDALKSGQFDATKDELTQAQQKIAEANAAREEELARQQQITLQNRADVANAPQRQNRPQPVPKIVDLQIGQQLDLREFDGPNMRVIVDEVEMDDLAVVLLDFDHMQIAASGDGYGHIASIGSVPTAARKRVEKENNSLIYRWGRNKLVYLDVMDVAQNHVKLGIVSE